MNKDIKKEQNDDNKHTVFLAIIAMCTMIIVVIGATFAYLANTADTSKNAQITATTDGGDSVFIMSAGDPLEILANIENHGSDRQGTTLTDDTISTVALSASSAMSKKYAVSVTVDTNNFTYSSGACYRLPESDYESTFSSKDSCESGGHYWAVNNKDESKCYNKAITPWASADNKLSCTIDSRNVWVKKVVPELTISLYKNSDESSCSAGGVCVTPTLDIDANYTDSTSCEAANNTWVSNVVKDGQCFILVKKIDVTEAEITNQEDVGIELIDEITISVDSTNKTKTDYYYTVLGFENFEFNQIENGNKKFTGGLNFYVVD